MRAFITGHRNINREIGLYGIKLLIDKVQNECNDIEHYYCGMALGTDQLFAEYLIEQNLPFTAVIPFTNQWEKWSISQQKHYHYLLKFSQQVIIISPEYTSSCTHLRNNYMINHSEICLGIYDDRNYGGTKSTVNKAISHGLKTLIFNPKTEEIIVYHQMNLFQI